MVLTEFAALLLCGTFFGAAVYVSIAQHPASMKAGVAVAAKFFPPMYGLAAPMQILCAVGGTIAGFIQWYLVGDTLWAVGAGLLIFVIPYTLIVLKPINDQLLDSTAERSDAQTEALLNQWAPRHWARSVASGASFAVYLWASLNA